jgi:protoheme IX farnesyltransferase
MSQIFRDYIKLTKPWIMSLLLVTALGGMVLAAEGWPETRLVIAVLVGGALASGGASALNHAMEPELDRRMRRTGNRPVANNRISVRRATLFGVTLNLLSFIVLYWEANLLAAALTIGGSVLYIGFYTYILKRSTIHNIVVGGIGGALPPLVGWAAVNGNIELSGMFLLAIVFFWTPPHFWALALLIRDDYEAAKVPMLPVIKGESVTAVWMLAYAILLIPLTWLLYFANASLGLLYLATSGFLGIGFIWYCWKLIKVNTRTSAAGVYKFSLLYLPGVFIVIMIDASFNM